MENYSHHRLVKNDNGYELILYIDGNTEFSTELGSKLKPTDRLKNQALNFMNAGKLSTIKITKITIMIGTMMITSFNTNEVEAAVSDTQNTQQQTIELDTYTVAAGDSLSVIARRFNISTQQLRSANTLNSDLIRIGQQLKLPFFTYTVQTGDSLSVLARNYGTSANEIRQLNQLTGDVIRIGQKLKIPVSIQNVSSDQEVQLVQPLNPVDSYTVVSGDTLSGLARRFNTTVSHLQEINNLTNDFLSIGQQLTVPAEKQSSSFTTPTRYVDAGGYYTVKSGDSLSVIARDLGTTVPQLRTLNNLTTDTLQVGQKLKIGAEINHEETVTSDRPSEYTVASGDTLSGISKRFGIAVDEIKQINNLNNDFIRVGQVLKLEVTPLVQSYTVKSGDSLSVIARDFGTTVESLKRLNHLTSNTIRVGQVLQVQTTVSMQENEGQTVNKPPITENTVTYTTHTVISGDNIWKLSVQYGIPDRELLAVNNLTRSSVLKIGQELTIPVHEIAVQSTVSERHGEYLDWWTEAQYVFPIGTTAKVTDFITGESFNVKRTIGANHADVETLTQNDTNIARSIWGGFSWNIRSVIVEVNGRRIAASMSFFPHDVQYIHDNGMNGHVDIHFKNSTRHVDGAVNLRHQELVREAAGVQ